MASVDWVEGANFPRNNKRWPKNIGRQALARQEGNVTPAFLDACLTTLHVPHFLYSYNKNSCRPIEPQCHCIYSYLQLGCAGYGHYAFQLAFHWLKLKATGSFMGKYFLAWLLGVPTIVLLIIYFLMR